MMNTILQDMRYATRMLLKQPAFTAIAILTLAIGIGANTAIFSIVNAVLLRPLPYPHSEQLVLLRERQRTRQASTRGPSATPITWIGVPGSAASRLALVRRESFNVSAKDGAGQPVRVTGALVTSNFLSLLGIRPRLGRDLADSDDVPGAATVTLISEQLWRERFDGSPAALGQQIILNGVPREIIGVVPETVRFPRASNVFIPLANLRADKGTLDRGNHNGFSGA